MATVGEHYSTHLAKHYSWLFGDFDAKVDDERRFFVSHGLSPRASARAIDLGAGPGFQSIALADLGYFVTAVDLCPQLLAELEARAGPRRIATIEGDLLEVVRHLPREVELCVCMGDTLTHLPSLEQVALLFERVYGALAEGGALALAFADLTVELSDLHRFISVRSDPDTVFTCFLEYERDHVRVHDLVHLRSNGAWTFRKSWYRKLRIPMAWVVEHLERSGFAIQVANSTAGVVTVIARRQDTIWR
jgi:SAM-dependent methyltransferase